ncbi:MAG: hypothetical protein ACKVWV_14030 [Planctomycetota bacterium]
MSASRPSNSNATAEPRKNAELGCLVQLFWSIGGCGLLTAIAVLILRQPPWTLSLRDAVFWSFVGAMVFARAVDVRRFGGQTADGNPATMKDVRRYALGLVVSAALVWAAAQSFHFGPKT